MAEDLDYLDQINEFRKALRYEFRESRKADILIDCNEFFEGLDDGQKVSALNFLMGMVNRGE